MRKIKREITGAFMLVCIVFSLIVFVDFIRFPECYVNHWRDGLKREIDAGNEKYIEFYNERYVKNGRVLFEEV